MRWLLKISLIQHVELVMSTLCGRWGIRFTARCRPFSDWGTHWRTSRFRSALIKKKKALCRLGRGFKFQKTFKAGPPPLEAILVIFGRRALIFFCLKALGKKWKMTPLLCACAVVITLETQKCRKRAPRSVELNFFNNCDRQKQFSQNERRRADLQKIASDFLIFAWGLSYDLSKFSDDFTPFFRLWKTITKSLGKN